MSLLHLSSFVGVDDLALKASQPVTHARQHAGDILRGQERSNFANVIFRTALGKHDALEARLLGLG
jgi:hypothetical protein